MEFRPTLQQLPVEGPRPSLALIGTGRLGTALAVAAHQAGYAVAAVAGRRPHRVAELAGRVGAQPVTTPLAAVTAADITLLALPDGLVVPVAATIAASGMALRDHALAHVSGALDREALAAARQRGGAVGAIHPLRSFTGAEGGDAFHGAFVSIEADARLEPGLRRLITDLGAAPLAAPRPELRALYHAAAVLVGNAPLALLDMATRLGVEAGLDRATALTAFADLLEGMARNARRAGLRMALTGPVVRGDAGTVARHLGALAGHPSVRRLYAELSAELLALAGTEGRESVERVLAAAVPGVTDRPHGRGGTAGAQAPGDAHTDRIPRHGSRLRPAV